MGEVNVYVFYFPKYIQPSLISTCNQCQKIETFKFFYMKCLKSSMCFSLTAQFSLDRPYFQ